MDPRGTIDVAMKKFISKPIVLCCSFKVPRKSPVSAFLKTVHLLEQL